MRVLTLIDAGNSHLMKWIANEETEENTKTEIKLISDINSKLRATMRQEMKVAFGENYVEDTYCFPAIEEDAFGPMF